MMKKIFVKPKLKIGKGDEVLVICGKDKGKKGIVKTVFTKSSLITIDGINKFKKAIKINQNNNENYLIRERPVLASKVRLIKKSQNTKKSKKESKN